MTIFRKQYLLLVFTLVVAASILTGAHVIQLDWQVAHRSKATQMPPINWLGYLAEYKLAKAEQSLIKSTSKGLPQVHLFIAQQAQNALIEDVPTSTKRWQQAYKLSQEGKLIRVKVRHRGDNPFNWMYGKKSWRVKTSKKNLENRIRTLDYIVPQGVEWHEYTGYLIARGMGVTVPHFKLVELYINGDSAGVYLEKAKLDESFLRNENFMPVNLYKGEQYNLDWKLRVDDSLFNNPGLWKKLANFNQKKEEDFNDLKKFLDTVREAESSAQIRSKIFEKIPIKVWARYAAFQMIGGGFHNDWKHNQRIISDPWSGYFIPTPTDIDPSFFDDQQLDTSSDEVLRLLNQIPLFLDKKYEILYDSVNKNRVLPSVASSLRDLKDQFQISSRRDIHRLQTYYSGLIDRQLIQQENLMIYFDAYWNKILKSEYILKDRLEASPNANWKANANSLSLQVHGELPVKNLTLVSDTKAVHPPKVYFDQNNNHMIDQSDLELPTEIVDGNVQINALWYANRVPEADIKNGSELPGLKLTVASTEFRLLFDDNVAPTEAMISNPFTGKSSKISKTEATVNLPSSLNQPLFSTPNKQTETWSGVKSFYSDQVFRAPVVILPGTKIRLGKGVSLVFRRNVQFLGENNAPITVAGAKDGDVWGGVTILGQAASGSIVKHTHFQGGSGGEVDGVRFTGMFSIHNSSQIEVRNAKFSQNNFYDDMLHCVYCDDVKILNSVFKGARADAIDIDISKKIYFDGVHVEGSGNDAIDLMTSAATVINTTLINSGDKGLSVGEASKVFIANSQILENKVGIEAKDGSNIYAFNTDFLKNGVQVSAYSKNWRYGAGGSIDIRKSIFSDDNISDDNIMDEIRSGSHLYLFDNSKKGLKTPAEYQSWGISLPDMSEQFRAHIKVNRRGSEY